MDDRHGAGSVGVISLTDYEEITCRILFHRNWLRTPRDRSSLKPISVEGVVKAPRKRGTGRARIPDRINRDRILTRIATTAPRLCRYCAWAGDLKHQHGNKKQDKLPLDHLRPPFLRTNS